MHGRQWDVNRATEGRWRTSEGLCKGLLHNEHRGSSLPCLTPLQPQDVAHSLPILEEAEDAQAYSSISEI